MRARLAVTITCRSRLTRTRYSKRSKSTSVKFMANKILIVDDEPFNLDLLEQELMDYDYVLERAVDGLDALEKADAFAPDLILLDYMMPKMSGLEVVKQLRQNERHRSVPVILVTAKATQE